MLACTLLDEIMPAWDAASRHALLVAAPPDRVYAAARHSDLGRPWPVRLLMGLRAGPARLAAMFRRSRGSPTRPAGMSRAESHGERPHAARRPLGEVGFTPVAERPGDEFVLGLMGRFWIPSGGIVPTAAEDFRRPPPAGLAQAVWNFRVTPIGGGTKLSTETRVRCGDDATRRQFLRYWRVIRPGSGLIRGSILRSIRAAAERDARRARA